MFALRGSYAGAIGIPQFMPGSTRRYAVDFDGNGAIDLRRSPVDAIGSVANFLKEHGWQAGGEVLLRGARGRRRLARAASTARSSPSTPPRICALRAWSSRACPKACARWLLELETPDEPSEYRIGLHNFCVLTRYNRSAFYASAVYDLAQAVKKSR